MASSFEVPSQQSFDLVNGRWIIPKSVTSDSEFKLILTAYEGRNKCRFQKGPGERRSTRDIKLDTFLKLVTGQIKSTCPFNTLVQAITFYGSCEAVRERDFDLLKRILDFLLEYDILTERQYPLLWQEICIRIPAKREVEVARLVRAQRRAEEALVQTRLAEAEREEEEFWNSPEVATELERADRALEKAANPPRQELIVLAGLPEGPDAGLPLPEALETNRSLFESSDLC
jgi:hypothetical protein